MNAMSNSLRMLFDIIICIENQLHWVLDVSFKEDTCRGCQGYSAENLTVMRHIGVNLLSQEKTASVGIENKRLKAGWDNRYLETVLNCLNGT